MVQKKTLKDLNLLDRFLFSEAMADPENMRDVLEIILGRDIMLAHLPQPEKEQNISPQYRGIRLDVWSKDTEGKVYDAETQNKDTHNLPKRSRCYQGIIDSRLLEPGNVDFNTLNDVFIILIAPFDLFGRDRFVYTFEMRCREETGLILNDGATRIFLNCHGKNENEVRPELVELLRYMEYTTDAVANQCSSSKIHRMNQSIQKIRSSEEVSVRFMQAWEERIIEKAEAREEGLREGLQEGLREGRDSVNRLIQLLLENGREGEIKRVVEDTDYQEKLFREFHI